MIWGENRVNGITWQKCQGVSPGRLALFHFIVTYCTEWINSSNFKKSFLWLNYFIRIVSASIYWKLCIRSNHKIRNKGDTMNEDNINMWCKLRERHSALFCFVFWQEGITRASIFSNWFFLILHSKDRLI